MKQWIASLCLAMPLVCLAEASDLTIVPNGELPTTVAPHGTVKVNYTITNTTDRTLQNIGIRFSPTGHTPRGIMQISSVPNCTDPFSLAPGESCNLLMMVTADDLEEGMAKGGPELCSTAPPPVRCSIPFPKDTLNLKIATEKSDKRDSD